MDPIKDIIPEVISRLSSKKIEESEKVHRVWDLVTPESAAFTKIENYKEGILSIIVDSSTRLYRFKLKRRNLLELMKEEISDIKDITFKIGKIK